MKKLIITALCTPILFVAQVSIGNTSPNPNALLDLTNTENKVFKIHQVELVQTSQSSPLTNHLPGMLVYNTSTSNDLKDALYYNNGNQWLMIDSDSNSVKVGDIKQTLHNTDHSGWYILDGRNISTLPLNATNNAISLGFTTTLPDATDRFIRGISGTDSVGTLGGRNNFTLTRANLPAISYTGTTSSNGAHTHTYVDRASQMWHGQTGTGITALVNTGGATRTTAEAGNHTHLISVPLGGSNAAINLKPRFWNIQTFIYLGN